MAEVTKKKSTIPSVKVPLNLKRSVPPKRPLAKRPLVKKRPVIPVKKPTITKNLIATKPTTPITPVKKSVVTPPTNTKQNIVFSKEKRGIEYPYAGRRSLIQILKDAVPAYAIPTKKTPYILSGIFTLVVIIGILNFPLFGMFSGNVDVSVKMGLPLTFLEFKLMEPEENPVFIGNLIVDLLIYIFLAYLIDIAINMFLHAKFLRSEEEKKGDISYYQDPRLGNTREGIIKKIFGN